MALDYSGLTQAPTFGQSFMAGRQAAAAEQERNALRQMQAEQMAMQRENMLAQRAERDALAAQRRREIDTENALAEYVRSGMPQGLPGLAQFGKAGAQAMTALPQGQAKQLALEMDRLKYVTQLLSGANPQNYGMVRQTIGNISPDFAKAMPEQFDAEAVGALAKQGQGLAKRFVNTPYGIFDTQNEKYLMPESLPSRAAAPGAAPAPAAPKPPVGYRFTDGGNLEPIPGGPAAARAVKGAAAPGGAAAVGTPAQQAKAAVQQDAREKLSQDLTNQLGYYEQLAKIGAMVSPGRPAAANIAAYARASGIGQETERALGTQAQTLRDNIANARQRLLMHVKNATGATASQMNSNVELQTWLNSLTNPQQSIETVRETLGQLDAVLGSVRDQVERDRGGSVKKPAAAQPAAPATAPAAPRRREIAPGVFVTERP